MANVVIVVGPTGSGKSTSMKNLDPKETYVINVLNKPLPFKGSRGMYAEEKKNIQSTDDYFQVKQLLEIIPVKRTDIKNIIIDDVGFVMTTEFFKRSHETGYNKFTDIGKHMQEILETAKNLKQDLNIVFMFHDDDDYNDKTKIGKKVKTIGSLLDDKYDPLAIVSIALFTNVTFDKSGKASYEFITNRTLINNIIIPAKSPDGMFPEGKVPNDLKLVFEQIHEYYGDKVAVA